jgi:hypothetical protein
LLCFTPEGAAAVDIVLGQLGHVVNVFVMVVGVDVFCVGRIASGVVADGFAHGAVPSRFRRILTESSKEAKMPVRQIGSSHALSGLSLPS